MNSPRLMDQVRDVLRVHHYSLRTEQGYLQWIKRRPREMGEAEITAFLTYLAVKKDVSAYTQIQALFAILFLYKKVLCLEHDWLDSVVRAKQTKRLPVILSRETVGKLLERLTGTQKLVAYLIYGTGMRLMEALRLRVKDIDFNHRQITIRGGKGDKDQGTMLPNKLLVSLQRQLVIGRRLYDLDRAEHSPGVELLHALARKYPNADKEWLWCWAFPARHRSQDPRSGVIRPTIHMSSHCNATSSGLCVNLAWQRLCRYTRYGIVSPRI